MTHLIYRRLYDKTISLTAKGSMRFKKRSIRMPIRIYNSQSDYFLTFIFRLGLSLPLSFLYFDYTKYPDLDCTITTHAPRYD